VFVIAFMAEFMRRVYSVVEEYKINVVLGIEVKAN
jgi:hypothetical protein